MPKNKGKVQTDSKGVTATGSDINDSINSKQFENADRTPTDNLQNVKEDVRNVIELMGPSTPHLTLNTSSEADNEDSYITSTSIYSSVLQVKQHFSRIDESVSNKQQSWDTPRDISQISALPVDSPSSEHADECQKCGQNDQVEIQINQEAHHLTCPCRQYVKNLQQLATSGGINIFKSKENHAFPQKLEQQNEKRGSIEKAMNLLQFLKFRRPSKDDGKEPLDLYKINILQTEDDHSPPRRLIFDKIDDIPKPETNTVATNTVKEKPEYCNRGTGAHIPGLPGVPTPFHSYISPPKYATQVHKYPEDKRNPKLKEYKNTTRVDVYYFDHGNASYFRTTDCPPALITEVIAEKTEAYTAKFWAEFFGSIHIGFSFFTAFILQLLRFFLQSFVRPLTVGLTQLTSDYCFKPCLAVIFNAIIQPPLIFFYNIATSLRDLADPLAESVGYFLKEVANICRAIRLVEIKQKPCSPPVVSYKKRKLKTKRIK